jgi:hypothetical protein
LSCYGGGYGGAVYCWLESNAKVHFLSSNKVNTKFEKCSVKNGNYGGGICINFVSNTNDLKFQKGLSFTGCSAGSGKNIMLIGSDVKAVVNNNMFEYDYSGSLVKGRWDLAALDKKLSKSPIELRIFLCPLQKYNEKGFIYFIFFIFLFEKYLFLLEQKNRCKLGCYEVPSNKTCDHKCPDKFTEYPSGSGVCINKNACSNFNNDKKSCIDIPNCYYSNNSKKCSENCDQYYTKNPTTKYCEFDGCNSIPGDVDECKKYNGCFQKDGEANCVDDCGNFEKAEEGQCILRTCNEIDLNFLRSCGSHCYLDEINDESGNCVADCSSVGCL